MANDVISSLQLNTGNVHVFTTPYATCGTAAATAAKVATTTPQASYALGVGSRITVKFTYKNSVAAPTLNVNSTGAKPIFIRGRAMTANDTWKAGSVVELVYDGTNWNLLDNNINVVPFIVGTQTSATGSWTGVAKDLDELVDGQRIFYWLPYNGSGNASLNLTLADGTTTTGAINCYRSGTGRLSTHYPAGSIIPLTYRKNISIGGSGSYTGWWCDGDYYDDTRVTNTLSTTTKAYITGTSSTITSTTTQVFDTGVYLSTTAGRLETGSLTVGATSSANGKCALVYDTTNECVNFVFQ